MSEIEMTPIFSESYEELLAPQSFWENLSYYIKNFNQELTSHEYHPLEGIYLTLPPQGKEGCGYCKITKEGEVTCGHIDEYRNCVFKYRPCGWFNSNANRLHAFKSEKPFSAGQITLLYCNL